MKHRRTAAQFDSRATDQLVPYPVNGQIQCSTPSPYRSKRGLSRVIILVVALLAGMGLQTQRAVAASSDFNLEYCTIRVSGFEYYGSAAASTRNLSIYSNETCTGVRARVTTQYNTSKQGPWEYDFYTRVSQQSNSPFEDYDWRYAYGTARRYSVISNEYGISRY